MVMAELVSFVQYFLSRSTDISQYKRLSNVFIRLSPQIIVLIQYISTWITIWKRYQNSVKRYPIEYPDMVLTTCTMLGTTQAIIVVVSLLNNTFPTRSSHSLLTYYIVLITAYVQRFSVMYIFWQNM